MEENDGRPGDEDTAAAYGGWRLVCGLEDARRAPQCLEAAPGTDELAAIARHLDLPEVSKLNGRLDLRRDGARRFRLKGTLDAAYVQLCGVSLEPIEVSGPLVIDRVFEVGEGKPGSLAQEVAEESDSEEEIVDEIADAPLDVVPVLVEELALSLDPYPRKADAPSVDHAFPALGGTSKDQEEASSHPFAALARLREDKE